MDAEAQAVLFNAVPLLIVAALYLAVGVARLPALGRERGLGLVVRAGLAAAIAGVAILVTQEPLAGQVLVSLVVILLAAIPALLLAIRVQAAAAEAQILGDRGSGPVRSRTGSSTWTRKRAIAGLLLDELAEVFELDVANLALIEDGGRRARLVAARDGGRDNEQLMGQELDLESEASGISTATREGAAFAVLDEESSPIVNQRLNQISRVKSCAFVPMLSAGEVVGVVFAAVRTPRLFGDDELARMQTLAAEAGLALARVRASAALEEALERERLIGHISREVRSLRDLDELLRVAVEETAKAIRVDRCFIRLGEPGEEMPIVAEWVAAGMAPIGDFTRLPVVNLAAREQRTVVVGDVLDAPEVSDTTLGYVRELVDRGSRGVLAAPIVSFGGVIGVLGCIAPRRRSGRPRKSPSPRRSRTRRRSRSTRAGCSARAPARRRSSAASTGSRPF